MWSLFHGKSLRQYYIASSEQIDLEKNNISASQEYSDKVEKRMNRLLITRREFKSNEEKSSWKSYVKYPGVLMVKKSEDQNYSKYMVATD